MTLEKHEKAWCQTCKSKIDVIKQGHARVYSLFLYQAIPQSLVQVYVQVIRCF